MKRLLSLIAVILLLASPLAAANSCDPPMDICEAKEPIQLARMSGYIAGAGGGAAANFCDSTTALVCDDKEGRSVTWTAAASTVNEQATSIAPTGTYSMSIDVNADATGGTAKTAFTAGNKTTTYFLAKFPERIITDGQTRALAYLWGTGAGDFRCMVGVNNTGGTYRFGVKRTGGSYVLASAISPTANTLYHIWLTYENGSGADHHCHAVFATDGVYSTGDTASVTDGGGTGGADELYLAGYDGAVDSLDPVSFDNIKVRTNATAVTPFGDSGVD